MEKTLEKAEGREKRRLWGNDLAIGFDEEEGSEWNHKEGSPGSPDTRTRDEDHQSGPYGRDRRPSLITTPPPLPSRRPFKAPK